MRQIVIALAALWIWASPAWATPPAQALFGFINNQSTAIYAGNSSVGVCIEIETQTAPGIWVFISTMECGLTVDKVNSHGGAQGYIEYIRPDINRILSSYFGGGTDVEAMLDEGFNTFFKFVGTQLVPK